MVVLDDGPIVSGETERTTAHLTAVLDERYFDLERLHGGKGARLAAESHAAAIDLIEQIVIEEGIDCGLLSAWTGTCLIRRAVRFPRWKASWRRRAAAAWRALNASRARP